QGGQVVDDAGTLINANLPIIVERSRQTSETVSANLPEVVDKVRTATDTVTESLPRVVERVDKTGERVAELAEDLRQRTELAGLKGEARDKGVVAYADSVLKLIASSGGNIGTKKTVGKGLKNPRPATEWVESARREAALMAVLGRTKKQMLQ